MAPWGPPLGCGVPAGMGWVCWDPEPCRIKEGGGFFGSNCSSFTCSRLLSTMVMGTLERREGRVEGCVPLAQCEIPPAAWRVLG